MRHELKTKHVLTLLTVVAFLVAAVCITPGHHSYAATGHQAPTHDMAAMATNAPFIDGATHAELVTDNAAYRLFFLSVAPSNKDSNVERTRQHLVLSQHAGLSSIEEQFTQQILSDFRTQYDALVEAYNAAAIKALDSNVPNDTAALKKFLTSRDQLVDFTRARLSSGLSPNAQSTLDKHVQREKPRMHVAVEQ